MGVGVYAHIRAMPGAYAKGELRLESRVEILRNVGIEVDAEAIIGSVYAQFAAEFATDVRAQTGEHLALLLVRQQHDPAARAGSLLGCDPARGITDRVVLHHKNLKLGRGRVGTPGLQRAEVRGTVVPLAEDAADSGGVGREVAEDGGGALAVVSGGKTDEVTLIAQLP